MCVLCVAYSVCVCVCVCVCVHAYACAWVGMCVRDGWCQLSWKQTHLQNKIIKNNKIFKNKTKLRI